MKMSCPVSEAAVAKQLGRPMQPLVGCCLALKPTSPSILLPLAGWGGKQGYKQINRERERGKKVGAFFLFSKQHSTKLEDEFFALLLSLFLGPVPPASAAKDVKTLFFPFPLSLSLSLSPEAQTLSSLPIANTQDS
jgi:hypothetical protein